MLRFPFLKKWLNYSFQLGEMYQNFQKCLYRSTNINPENFKNSPFFIPENVTALSEEEKNPCEGLVKVEGIAWHAFYKSETRNNLAYPKKI